MAKGLALVDVEALIAKYVLLSLKHSMGRCAGLALREQLYYNFISLVWQ